jgi:signal transduction histidine kinase
VNEYTIPLFLSGSLSSLVAFLIINQIKAGFKYRQSPGFKTAAEIDYKSEVLRTRLEVQEQALHHISSEIEENIGQVLSGAQMKLLALSGKLENREEAEPFAEVASRMEKSIKDLRNLSHLPDSTLIEKVGLIDALEKELTFVASIYKLECTFTYSKQIPNLSGEQDLLLFRIMQEAITNIYKHAAATKVTIHIGYAGGILTLHIADNGKGLDLNHYKGKGFGLQHIQDRIKLLKGNLKINTKPGEGTTLVLTCNLNHE